MRLRLLPVAVITVLLAAPAASVLAQTPTPAGAPARPAQAPLPADAHYTVHKATAAAQAALLAADDRAWSGAEVLTWGAAPYETRLRALWAPDGLYLRWDADDPAPWATMTQRDEHLWDEEVVEIFLDPAWAGKDYWELEISPTNVVCDVRMVAPHPTVTSDLTWNHEGLKTAVRHEKNADGSAKRWIATAFAPWAGFRSLPLPGESGVAAGGRRRVGVQCLSHRAAQRPGTPEGRRRQPRLVADRCAELPRPGGVPQVRLQRQVAAGLVRPVSGLLISGTVAAAGR